MSCKTLFNPEIPGTLLYICGCGWSGDQPVFRLTGTSYLELTEIGDYWETRKLVSKRYPYGFYGWKSAGNSIPDPIVTLGKGTGQSVKLQRVESEPFVAECPCCRAHLEGEILLDVNNGSKIVNKKNKDGSSWKKTIKTSITELRMPDDTRNISKWTWSNWGWCIFWPNVKVLDPEFPKKPKWDITLGKEKWLSMLNGYKRDRSRHLRKAFSLAEALRLFKREYNDEIAKERVRSLAISVFGSLNVKMSKTFTLRDLWSLAIERQKVADAQIDKAIRRTRLSSLQEACGKDEIKWESLINLLEPLMANFGDIGIRTTVIKGMRANAGMWVVKGAKYVPYDKSTYKVREFIEEHKEDFFENPEYSMDRGIETVDSDKEVVVCYDPEEGELVETRALPSNEDPSPLSYHEWDSDDWNAFDEQDDIVDTPNECAIKWHGGVGSTKQWKYIGDAVFEENRRHRPEPPTVKEQLEELAKEKGTTVEVLYKLYQMK